MGGPGDNIGHEAILGVLVNAVGGEDENIAACDANGLVVDLELRIDAQRTAEIDLLGRDDHPVIFGKLLSELPASR